ncbi:hypothetical protein HETIRDRAFT_309768 [Heterobasidion irregulare TC 32-1]|uniref:Uncharacterized protein n=1 Tax=Heterobasidion irregulare (strain TC 32-1) TaxID=747525 RepID=W4KH79_HETIT|nr:uncharacterized protein HETIRDRAFT_309768 [Heterobasidion irregulare TC 32-1]ETW85074.1 hypothetical protein HETIRDRAFT_309768 [Heterobasidion irregulare TC 32-1]
MDRIIHYFPVKESQSESNLAASDCKIVEAGDSDMNSSSQRELIRLNQENTCGPITNSIVP